MANGIWTSVAAVAGFTAVGVATMYLLDPEQGKKRRAALLAAAGNMAGGTGDAMSATYDAADGSARAAGNAVADRHAQLRSAIHSAVKDRVGSVVSTAKGIWSKASDAVGDAQDGLSDRASDWHDRVTGAVDRLAGKDKPHPVASLTGHTVGTVGVLAAGAGLMWVLDPTYGKARRDDLVDRVTGFTRRVGYNVRDYGRQLGNKDQPSYPVKFDQTDPTPVPGNGQPFESTATSI